MRNSLVATLLLAGLAGCGGGDTATVDGHADTGSNGFDAPASFGARMPKAIAKDPSAVMTNPKGMAITWDSDPNRADEEKFFGAYGASPDWAAQTAEYNVGTLGSAAPGRIAGAAPTHTDETAMLQLLATNLTGTTPAWGKPDKNTIYMFFIPVGTVLYDDDCDLTCGGSDADQGSAAANQCGSAFGGLDGYHSDTVIGGVDIAYAFSAACHDEATYFGITDLQDVDVTAGHETVEAATDPRFGSDGFGVAWDEVDDAHSAWEYVTEGEIADLCEFADTANWLSPPGLAYTIQRTWSNTAAAAGHDPCVGDGTTPYAQAIPDDADLGVVNYEGVDQHTAGTKIAVGATGTLALQIYADAATAGPFKVTVVDYDGTDSDPLLTFVQPTGTFKPGDKIMVPVTVKKADDPDIVTGGEPIEIDTTPVGGGPTTYWYAWILQ